MSVGSVLTGQGNTHNLPTGKQLVSTQNMVVFSKININRKSVYMDTWKAFSPIHQFQ